MGCRVHAIKRSGTETAQEILIAIHHFEVAQITQRSRIPGLQRVSGEALSGLRRIKEEDAMAMEHRWGRRVAVDLSVTLHYRPIGRLRGRLRDLSSGGAFVQIPAFLTPNVRVQLVFTSGRKGTAHIHRFETVVSRVTPDGVGLMFLQFDPKALSALLLQLESEGVRPRLTAPRTATRVHDTSRDLPNTDAK